MAQDEKDFTHGFGGDVAQAFANQVDYCRANGAPVTARAVAAIAAALDSPEPGPFLAHVRDWQGQPLADALPLRAAGALHALHLSGGEPALAPLYAGEAADDGAIVGDVLRRHGKELLPWLDGPPQTNEAGRSSNFVAAMLWLAGNGLPPRFECLEVGSSAGINLMLDRYRYDLGGMTVGPEQAAMAFTPEWRGAPPPDEPISFASLKGCDVAPVDLTDPGQALRLRAYIWPEHTARFARLDAAIAAANERAPDLVKMNAADFTERELARPQPEGTTRVLMHSIVMQYVPEEQRERIAAAMERAGAGATPDKALAWVSVEADRTMLGHVLKVRYWPGGGEWVTLARAHAHGAWIEWQAEA
ncbi:DUF2332 domain-containing protein [Novosphingobium beihaiensis]|uniref:DUF2332 domain-containing protein n=1 Tax=Novosphingobium beihaiensis TaxID=2930389 RepID=A0ABT0BT28_9SPHN|nr:DUF2332 domain-containing protein [Novosphingobium beihaiensis]MCJ2188211.1 DUF2332 domain-containing protein [Novosphingobium beihaiensis]